MRSRLALAVLIVHSLVLSFPAFGQERPFSILFKGNLTTASRLFPHPNSPDAFERSQYVALEDFLGYGAELRYQVPGTNIALGLSSDYIHATSTELVRVGSSLVPLQVGYRVIPVEVTGYFLIPVSTRTFGLFMGGGMGVYLGSQVYKLGDTEAPGINRGRGFGIHVLGGMSYRFTEWFALVGEMKFRDLQFTATNQFSSPSISYNGSLLAAPRTPLDARVYTEGIVFQVGTMISF